MAREPWEKANIERFRRALVLLGEPDPDALIAARLSGESPFMSTDLSPAPQTCRRRAAEPAPRAESNRPSGRTDAESRVAATKSGARPAPSDAPGGSSHFELSANAIDLESILGDFESPAPPVHAASEDVEVDLSIVLDDIKPAAPPASARRQPAGGRRSRRRLRQPARRQSAKRSGLDEAEKEYKRGLALRAAGDIDGCIQALEKASRAPKLRFGTSWLIARLYRERDMMPQALEWLERASQAPAPTTDESHQLLFELAEALEKTGEVARALAVCMELQSDAGSYRDVAERIDRLTKVQAGG